MVNPFAHVEKKLDGGATFYSLPDLKDTRVDLLPYSIRVLLEAAVRNCDEFEVKKQDVENILNWQKTAALQTEIPFKPSRVLMQDLTGVPAVVDLAAMRDCMSRLGGKATKIDPQVPVDLVIDHSVALDFSRSADCREKNEAMEFQRNGERFRFLKWGANAFESLRIIPPGSGIVHQVNLEFLAPLVFDRQGTLYPDSVVGTDSHTTMINGLGVVGWGVGGIEAEAVMLGQPISMVLPQVVGFRLEGKMHPPAMATDVVLTITKMLRQKGVVGKFVEFFGPGVQALSLADRATIANMAPEYGATMGFFPVDQQTLDYLRQSGRDETSVKRAEAYLKAQGLFRIYDGSQKDPVYTGDVVVLDLSTVKPSIAGPKRPHDHVLVEEAKADFLKCLQNPVGFKGFGISEAQRKVEVVMTYRGKTYKLGHGAIVIAAITSCTNTSNPSVMLAAGLLAKNAVAKGLAMAPYIKTSLSPGSGVVERYLKNADVLVSLEKLGFHLAGFGCMTCIGNSGDLDEEVTAAVQKSDIVAAAVLSGNRNFEGRVHPLTRANYLASPPLVVAYALAGRMDFDFATEPLHVDSKGNKVFLKDVWPTPQQILDAEKCVAPVLFREVYETVKQGGSQRWRSLDFPQGDLFEWDVKSTYIHNPPFFSTMGLQPQPVADVEGAYCLLNVGDSVTTDHISPAGKIAKDSPAALYLTQREVKPVDFNSYGSRRGNDEVMARGTFANIRLTNKLASKVGPTTLHIPSGQEMPIFDAADKYIAAKQPLVILAGREYGTGSSRDWAAKGPFLLGVRAVVAVSFERIHRSNLVGMGILPLEFMQGESADSLGLDGHEKFSMKLEGGNLKVGQEIEVTVHKKDDTMTKFRAKCRLDTEVELEYFKHGGILHYVLRKLATSN